MLSLFYSKISISIIGGKGGGLVPQKIKEGCPFYKEDLGSYERTRTRLKIQKDKPSSASGAADFTFFAKIK